MAQSSIPVRFVFRSQTMIELLTIMECGGLWRKHGIDVRDFEAMYYDPLGAEEKLFSGEIDFIFGNHVTPHMRLTQGHQMVCLAQTMNYTDEWVVTSPEITEISMLQGKRVIGKPLILPNGAFSRHNNGNRILLLELHGVDTRQVDFIDPSTVEDSVEAVRDGRADGVVLRSRRGEDAKAAGLRVHEVPPMGMIHNITFTTMLPRVQQQPEFAERIIRVMLEATQFFATRRDETLDMLKDPVYPLSEGRIPNLRKHYDERVAQYDTKLYPHAEAIINQHKLSCMVYPEAKQVNALELWDLRPLREVHIKG